MAESPMQAIIKRFMLSALVLYPVCVAVWYLFGQVQVDLAVLFSKYFLSIIHPSAVFTADIQGTYVSFSIIVEEEKFDTATVGGGCYPLLKLSGIPLYAAFMLASPNIKQRVKLLPLGILGLVLFGFTGVVTEVSHHLFYGLSMLKRDGYNVPGIGPYTLMISNCLMIISSVFSQLVLPLVVWLWQQRDGFVRELFSTPEVLPR